MRFQTPLIHARLIRRYKRFLADVTLDDGAQAVAHCPNPGAMTGLAGEGSSLWLEPNDDPRKKLRYGWRIGTAENGAPVVVDTGLANRIVAEALAQGRIEGVKGSLRAEVPYGENSRVDFVIEDAGAQTYLEVKSVSLSRQAGLAEFPDSVTKRGTKHLHDLAQMVAQGHRAAMLFLVVRPDCTRFKPAADIDPAYAHALREAAAAGVQILCYDCDVAADHVTLRAPLPVSIA